MTDTPVDVVSDGESQSTPDTQQSTYRDLGKPTFKQLCNALVELPLLPFRPLWYVRRWCAFKALTYTALLILFSGIAGGFLLVVDAGDISPTWQFFDEWSPTFALVAACWSWVVGGATFVVGSLTFIAFLRLSGARVASKGAAARAYVMTILIASIPSMAWLAAAPVRFGSPQRSLRAIDEIAPYAIAAGIYSIIVAFLIATRVFGAGMKRSAVFFLAIPLIAQWLLVTPSGNEALMRGASVIDSLVLGTTAPADSTREHTIDRVQFRAPSNWRFKPFPKRGHPWSSNGAVAEQNQLTLYAIRYHTPVGVDKESARLSLEQRFMQGAVRFSRRYSPTTREDDWHHSSATYIPSAGLPEHTITFWVRPAGDQGVFTVVIALRIASDETEIQNGIEEILDSIEVLPRS